MEYIRKLKEKIQMQSGAKPATESSKTSFTGIKKTNLHDLRRDDSDESDSE